MMNDATRQASLFFVCATLIFCAACVTPRAKGDRAFEEGDYNLALDEYEALIKEGSRDPDIYHRAAKASVAIGGFSVAERYYSQAIRYGAGLNVARELGEFYVRTSNYASAVRVYQYLLEREEDSQAVYNNLGTALMYSGKAFDAESYLMIAQQMEPSDPLPYLNLGLLYDQHLQQPWLAISFYQCFSKLENSKSKQVREVEQRVRELKGRWSRLYEEGTVKCGEPYAPPVVVRKGNLKDLLADVGEEGTDSQTIELGDPNAPIKPVEVDRMVETLPERGEKGEMVEIQPEAAARIRKADAAFEKRQYQAVVSELGGLSISLLDREHKERLGASLLELGRAKEAVSWLELALNEGERPSTVALLLTGYRKNEQSERVLEICAKYAYKMEYREATQGCPAEAAKKNNLLEGAKRLNADGKVEETQ